MKRKRWITATATVLMLFVILAWGAWAVETGKVNINEATVEELIVLKRVGPKYAQRIVEYREENGPFQQAEDIMKVPGIGPKTWEVNQDIISVK